MAAAASTGRAAARRVPAVVDRRRSGDRRRRRHRSARCPVGRRATTRRPTDARVRPPTAATRSNGGPRVTLANGRLAAVSTTSTRIRRTTQPGAARTAPIDRRAPRRDHAAPPAERDDAGRHRRGDERDDDEVDERRQDREPAERRRGRSAASPPARPARRRGSRRASAGRGRGRAARSSSVSGVAQAMSPAVASDDSWNPASPMRPGP